MAESATVVDALIVKLGLDPTQFNEQSKKVQESLVELKGEAKKHAVEVEEHTGHAAEAIRSVSREILGLFAIFIGGRGLKEFFTDITRAQLALDKLSWGLRMTPQALDALGMMSERIGGSKSGTMMAVQAFADALQQWRITGTSPMSEGIAKLFGTAEVPIPPRNTDVEQYLAQVAEAAEKASKRIGPELTEALIRSFIPDRAMAHLLVRGREAYEKDIEEQKKNAPTDKQQKVITDLSEKFIDLKNLIKSIGLSVTENMAKPLTELFETISKWLEENKDKIKEYITDAFTALGTAITVITEDVKSAWPTIKEIFTWLDNFVKKNLGENGWIHILEALVAVKLAGWGLGVAASFGTLGIAVLAVTAALLGLKAAMEWFQQLKDVLPSGEKPGMIGMRHFDPVTGKVSPGPMGPGAPDPMWQAQPEQYGFDEGRKRWPGAVTPADRDRAVRDKDDDIRRWPPEAVGKVVDAFVQLWGEQPPAELAKPSPNTDVFGSEAVTTERDTGRHPRRDQRGEGGPANIVHPGPEQQHKDVPRTIRGRKFRPETIEEIKHLFDFLKSKQSSLDTMGKMPTAGESPDWLSTMVREGHEDTSVDLLKAEKPVYLGILRALKEYFVFSISAATSGETHQNLSGSGGDGKGGSDNKDAHDAAGKGGDSGGSQLGVKQSGHVDLTPGHVSPELLKRYEQLRKNMREKYGIELHTTYGYRDFAHQQEEWEKSGHGTRYAAAHPGMSPHGKGRAIDARPGGGTLREYHLMHQEAEKVGLAPAFRGNWMRDKPHLQLPRDAPWGSEGGGEEGSSSKPAHHTGKQSRLDDASTPWNENSSQLGIGAHSIASISNNRQAVSSNTTSTKLQVAQISIQTSAAEMMGNKPDVHPQFARAANYAKTVDYGVA
jgi:hypothetical protein